MRAVRRLVTWARCGTTSLAARAVRHMSSADAVKSSRLSKFHTLDIPGRVSTLEKAGFLTPETSAALRGQGLALDDANNMIENVLATFGVPMVSRKEAAGGVAAPVMCARPARSSAMLNAVLRACVQSTFENMYPGRAGRGAQHDSQWQRLRGAHGLGGAFSGGSGGKRSAHDAPRGLHGHVRRPGHGSFASLP